MSDGIVEKVGIIAFTMPNLEFESSNLGLRDMEP